MQRFYYFRYILSIGIQNDNQPFASEVHWKLDLDFENFLQNDILVKTDRGSMANSLEVRSPFLSI